MMELSSSKATVTAVLIEIICAFGLIGNFLCFIVILSFIRKGKTSPFHYFLLGLCFSDTLLLMMSMIKTFHQLKVLDQNNSPRYLEITFFALSWISSGGTKYFTVAVSLERYFVICHPIRAQRFVTQERAPKFTLAVFGFVICLTIFSYIYLNYIDQPSYSIYTAIVLDLIPFLLVVIFNAMLYNGLREYQRKRSKLTEGEIREISVSKMLLTVVLAFGICYSFDFIRRIMVFAKVDFDYSKYDWYDYTINCLAGVGFVLNSAVNFIIYCLMGDTFYREFVNIVTGMTNAFMCRKSDEAQQCLGGGNKKTTTSAELSSTFGSTEYCDTKPNPVP